MSKKTIIIILLSVIASLSLLRANVSKKNQSELTKENIEALSFFDPIEWWNSKDYTCVPVTCQCILYEYPSEVSDSVENGQGEVAHSWNCAGCGDRCGWTMS